MASIGQSLRKARENRGISLEEVSKATKIRTEYLVALEGDDFERLPNNVFSRGFVRAYAEVVGLDPEAAVAASAVERKARGTEGEQAPDVLAELNRLIPDKVSPTEQRFRRRWLLVAAGAIVGVCVFGVVSWLIVSRGSRDPIARASAPVIREAAPLPVTSTAALPDLTPRRALQELVPKADATEIRETAPIPTRVAPSPALDELAAYPPNEERISSLSVPDFAIGRGVANRRVVDPRDSFDEGQTVWFWTRVEGAAPGERIRHVWLHAGQQVHTIDLELGGASWRTQSMKRMRPGSRGDWRVEARDAAGRVLAASDFVCR